MSVNAEGNVSFSPKLNDFTFDEYINDALDTIGMFAKQKGKKVVIAIDEFQQISTIDSPIDATLRKHLQEKMDFIWIFSGSKRHLLSELFVDQGKPLYKQAEGLEVKEINESELYEFASNHLTKSALSKDAFGLIYKISDGETKLIQQICNKLYTRRQLGDVGVIDVDTIHDVLNAILDGEDGVYRMIDGNLKPNQRKALRHLVRFSGVALLTHDKLKQTNISNSSLSRALGSLYDGVKGYGYIIDKEYDKYFIQDRTFEIWIYRIVFNRLPD